MKFRSDNSAPRPTQNRLRYWTIYKPYGMLSQFSKEGEHLTLADLNYPFPTDVYPVGRLDADSEGLLILTNDKKLTEQLLNPKFAHNRTYWVQTERIPTPEALQQLQKGVVISLDGKPYHTRPAKAILLETAPELPQRIPPIRFRAKIPTAWIELTLTEGKNRQVRKMTAAVGFPTLRLVRSAIENITINNIAAPDIIEWDEIALKELLRLKR